MKSMINNIMMGALGLMTAGFGLVSCANDSMMDELASGNTAGAPTLSLRISAPTDNVKIVDTRAGSGKGFETSFDNTTLKTLDIYIFRMTSVSEGRLSKVVKFGEKGTGRTDAREISELSATANSYQIPEIEMPLKLVGYNLKYVVVANNPIDTANRVLDQTKYSEFYNTTVNYAKTFNSTTISNDGSGKLTSDGMPFSGMSSDNYKLQMGKNDKVEAITLKRALGKIDVLNNIANLQIKSISVSGMTRSGYLLTNKNTAHNATGSSTNIYTRYFGGVSFGTNRVWKKKENVGESDAEKKTLDYIHEGTASSPVFTINYVLTLSDGKTLEGTQQVTAGNTAWKRNNRYLLQIGDDEVKCINYPPVNASFKVLGWYDGGEIVNEIDVAVPTETIEVGDVITKDGKLVKGDKWAETQLNTSRICGVVLDYNEDTKIGHCMDLDLVDIGTVGSIWSYLNTNCNKNSSSYDEDLVTAINKYIYNYLNNNFRFKTSQDGQFTFTEIGWDKDGKGCLNGQYYDFAFSDPNIYFDKLEQYEVNKSGLLTSYFNSLTPYDSKNDFLYFGKCSSTSIYVVDPVVYPFRFHSVYPLASTKFMSFYNSSDNCPFKVIMVYTFQPIPGYFIN